MYTEVELRQLISDMSVPQWEAILQILQGQLEGLETAADARAASNPGVLTHMVGAINQMRYLISALEDWRLPTAPEVPVLKQTSI